MRQLPLLSLLHWPKLQPKRLRCQAASAAASTVSVVASEAASAAAALAEPAIKAVSAEYAGLSPGAAERLALVRGECCRVKCVQPGCTASGRANIYWCDKCESPPQLTPQAPKRLHPHLVLHPLQQPPTPTASLTHGCFHLHCCNFCSEGMHFVAPLAMLCLHQQRPDGKQMLQETMRSSGGSASSCSQIPGEYAVLWRVHPAPHAVSL